jgi:AraC-like DNA-binding protein
MLYHSRVPRRPLNACIDYLWIYRQEPRPRELERVLPGGVAQLVVNLSEDETRAYDPGDDYRCISNAGTVLAGTRTRYEIIDTAEQENVAGVVFKPGGICPFMRVPAHEVADADVPVEALWGRLDTDRLRERLLESDGPETALDVLEAVLLEKWTDASPHRAVTLALGVFDRAPELASVTAVTRAVGLSEKRFIEHFKADVGVTPKRYCRIRRFQRALAEVHRGRSIDWIQLALDAGYYDQAHFIHDFRSFTGLTPTDYRAARTLFPNHVKFLQDDHRCRRTGSGHD